MCRLWIPDVLFNLVRLAMQGVRLVNLKFGSEDDVTVIRPTGEPKIWLTIACALMIM